MEKTEKSITLFNVFGEFLFELIDKNDWINTCPRYMPEKKSGFEEWIWVDKNGFVFQNGGDFSAAETHMTFPCKVYRLINVKEYVSLKEEFGEIIDNLIKKSKE